MRAVSAVERCTLVKPIEAPYKPVAGLPSVYPVAEAGSRPRGAGPALEVRARPGASGGRRCGRFAGRSIELFSCAQDRAGRRVFCADLAENPAHELGHAPPDPDPRGSLVEPVRRFHREVHNRKRLELIGELIAEDYRSYGPDGKLTARGPQGELDHLRASFAFFPDLRTEVHLELADPPHVVVRWTGHGTHEGREVTLPGLSLFEVREGKIRRAWHHYDPLHALRQLGLAPVPGDE